MQHPHPCVPCILSVEASTIEHWKPWLIDSAECMASQWIMTSPGMYTYPKRHFGKDKAADVSNQVTAHWKTPSSTSFGMLLQHEDISSFFASYHMRLPQTSQTILNSNARQILNLHFGLFWHAPQYSHRSRENEPPQCATGR